MSLRFHRLLLAAFLLLGLGGCGGPVELVLGPAAWDFGTITADAPLLQEVTVANPGRRLTEVRLISTCACLTVEPAVLQLPGGSRAAVVMRYDPSDDEGEVSMQLIVRSGQGTRAVRQMLRVSGRVLPGPVGSGQPQDPSRARSASAQLPQFLFEYYYDPGCQGCELLLVRQMIDAQLELGIRLRVVRRHISDPVVHAEYLRRLEALGVEERSYPAVLFGDTVLQGDEEIEREFQRVFQRELAATRPEGASR